jgi:signal transduction histidine kinase
VYKIQGPFLARGEPAVRAAVDAGATYLDATGEPPFVRRVFEEHGPRAVGRCALIPAFGYDFVPGNLAGALALAEAQTALIASRARMVAAADATRRRIERNLHDGAQQRLVSLSLHLRGPVRAAVPSGADELSARLDAAAAELTSALDELRELVRGLHPSALADGGLGPALKALARRSAVPVRLDVRLDGRLPEPIELAVYYSVAETLTNTAAHASATVVDVEVGAGTDSLRVRVHDDGRGGADLSRGSGLVGLTDRVEALGGRLSLESPPGAGTTVQISLPLATPERA